VLDEYPKTIMLDDGLEFTFRPKSQCDVDNSYKDFLLWMNSKILSLDGWMALITR
jgi:hypothetical protein